MVRWANDKRGWVSSEGKPDLEVATPPEFKGHEGIWSPEDLFVASVNSCVMSTFLGMAAREGLNFVSYESEAEGVLEMYDGVFQFTTIVVKPTVILSEIQDRDKVKEVLTKAEANCLISHSMKFQVLLQPTIIQLP